MKRAIFITVCLFALAILWMFRYSMISSKGAAYRLNRFTGEIIFIAGREKHVVEFPKEEKTYIEIPRDTPLDKTPGEAK